jgi:hypothetical protein
MNRFGEIADELTELIEELDRGELAGKSRALKSALERAFARACEAERVLRAQQEAEPKMPQRAVSAGARPLRAVEVSGVVIQLPRAWRVGANSRRLSD